MTAKYKIIATVLFIISAYLFQYCSKMGSDEPVPQGDYCSYVDPFIGTGEHGHTYPGAVLPFGMVQLSPDTRKENWDGSSGYHYSDKTIRGFSHTHLSGTGESEFCDVMFMPTVGEIRLQPGDAENSESGYRSKFSHNNEAASPGYYKVLIDDYNVTAELTAIERSGFHRYTFPESHNSNIIIDLWHRGRVVKANIEAINDTVISGLTLSTGWAKDQYIYFYAKFSKSFKEFGVSVDDNAVKKMKKAAGKKVKAYVRFNTKKNEQILVKVGISAVSTAGAKKNLEAENSGWDFADIRNKAKKKWNSYLSKIAVEGGTEKEKRIFYTAMYHSALAPNLFMDVDGNYRGVDHKVHKAHGFTNYTVFSLWDVFRAQMPLLNILEPGRMNNFIKTFLTIYQKGGRLPIWEIQGTLSAHMIGRHALPVILDAYRKGIDTFNVALAYEGMKNSIEDDMAFNKLYKNFGYIPADMEGIGGSVSIAVEYSYNNWCVAEMAKILNKKADMLKYQQRAQFYKNNFDASSGFLRPRNLDHTWLKPFDPARPTSDYTEGNAFQYSAFVPHDITYGLIPLLGGDEKFIEWLDTLFTHTSQYDKNVVDASGLIGQYAHGNEPSHEIAYLYNYAGAAPKTQKYVREIINTLYDDTPQGLSGNEDCGQISAWYIFSALGFYPVLPGDSIYVIGSPLFRKAAINLNNGKTFTVKADDVSDKNIYIQSAKLNGRKYTKSWLSHRDIVNGGEIVFEMGSEPNYNWGTSIADRPKTKKLVASVSMPYYRIKENYFFDKATIKLGCDTEGAEIYYTTNGTKPTEHSKLYTNPFTINKTTVLKFFAAKKGLMKSTVVVAKIEKMKNLNYTHLKNYNDIDLKPGLKYKYYEEHILYVDELDKFKPKKTGITPNFSIAERENDGLFAFIYDGYIKIPRDGVYTFYLLTNDGGVLYLDGKRFIDMDGPRTASPKLHTIRLKAGTYKIGEKYFQMGAGFENTVSWKGPGIRKQVIPPKVLFHK